MVRGPRVSAIRLEKGGEVMGGEESNTHVDSYLLSNAGSTCPTLGGDGAGGGRQETRQE